MNEEVNIHDFKGSGIKIGVGGIHREDEVFIESRSKVVIRFARPETAQRAFRLLHRLIAKDYGLSFVEVSKFVTNETYKNNHRAYRPCWEPGWEYDPDALHGIPGRRFGDEKFEHLSQEDLRAKDWVIEYFLEARLRVKT